MLIEFMRLSNWRSFYGENDLWFSIDPEKNVTVIRAENGVGKTSLLAALNWCFFKDLPSINEFENPENLVNEFAHLNNGVTQTTVEVEFAHEDKRYRAARMYDQSQKLAYELKLTELTESGEVPISGQRPDRFINSVIPREMAPHFFFYGEATSRYTGVGGSKHFSKAVRSILGATVAKMALENLDSAFREYRKSAADNTSQEAKEISDEIEKLDTSIKNFEKKVSEAEDEYQSAEDIIDRLNKSLADSQVIKEDQLRRSKLEEDKLRLENEKSGVEKERQSWINSFATEILAHDLIADTKKLLDTQDTRRKFPGKYTRKYVNEVLEDDLCICGRPLGHENSPERKSVKSLLENGTDEKIIDRVMSTNAALTGFSETAKNAWEIHRRNDKDLFRIEEGLNDIESELSEISERLAKNNTSDIAEKEAKRNSAINAKKLAAQAQIDNKSYADRAQQKKEELVRKQNELTRQSEAARRYVKRAQISGQLMARLGQRLSKEEENARRSIEAKISTIIEKFMTKQFIAKLDSDYQLKIFNENNLEAAKSTGENQLLGLAFTGAIAQHAKDRRNSESDILLAGTEAPLVVDSPFGHLDPTYRAAVSTFLPEMASQVVLLVSRSQASPEVLNSLVDKIGVEYVLTRHSEADAGEKKEEYISINGDHYDLTKYNSPFTGTVLTEVKAVP